MTHPRANRHYQAVTPAWWSLRAYGGSFALMAVCGIVVLAAGLPVASLMASVWGGLSPRVSLPRIPLPRFGITWSDLSLGPNVFRDTAVQQLFTVLAGLTLGLLAVSVVTIVALAVIRSSAREQEMRIRRAVGASRRQMLFGVLIEGGAMAGIVLALSLPLAVAATRIAYSTWPGPAKQGIGVLPVMVIAGVTAIIVLSACIPLARLRRGPLADRVPGKPPHLVLASFQLGVNLTALTSATLLTVAAARLDVAASDPDHDGVMLQVSGEARSPGLARRYQSLLHELKARSISNVSFASPGVLTGLGGEDLAVTDCGKCYQGGLPFPFHPILTLYHAVSPDTFQMLGMQMVAGRTMQPGDTIAAPPVVVVSRSLAAKHFERRRAVGRRIQIGEGWSNWYTVVGVVEDRPSLGFGSSLESRNVVYLSALQHPPATAEILVRPAAAVPAVRAVVASLPGFAPLDDGVREASILESDYAPVRWFHRLLAAQGWALLLLATAGTFALMQLWVKSLASEIGIRRSVGASRARIIGWILWRAGKSVLAGVALGLWLGILAWGTIAEVFTGLPVWQPATALRDAPLLAVVALAGVLAASVRLLRLAPAQSAEMH